MPLALTNLTGRLLASYACEGGIDHLDGKNLPSKYAVAEITFDLLRLLFPRFLDERPIHFAEVEAVTIALLANMVGRLGNEIGNSLE